MMRQHKTTTTQQMRELHGEGPATHHDLGLAGRLAALDTPGDLAGDAAGNLYVVDTVKGDGTRRAFVVTARLPVPLGAER